MADLIAQKPIYKRVLLKLSGEIISFHDKQPLADEQLNHIILSIKQIHDLKIQTAIVIGAGNILRGSDSEGMDRVRADHIGMMSTIINGLVLQEKLEALGVKVKVLSAFTCGSIAETYSALKSNSYLSKGYIVIFVGGTGCCFFSTDTSAAVRALEIKADIILKATKVDGVYDKDPKKHTEFTRFSKISYLDVLEKNLQVMDGPAIALCRENKLPIIIFDIFTKKILKEVILGKEVGTIISGE